MVKFRVRIARRARRKSDLETESETFFSDDLIQRTSNATQQQSDAHAWVAKEESKRREVQSTDPTLQPSASITCADDSLASRQKPLVFLSHEGGGPGTTTKKGEVSLLHTALKLKGIPAFLDEHSLRLGDRNAQVMIAAVKEAPVCES